MFQRVSFEQTNIFNQGFLSHLTGFAVGSVCASLPVVLCFGLTLSIKVFVCKQDSPTYREIQRQSGHGQRWKCRVKCVWAGDQSGQGAECQSCCWSWPPHMALCPGDASRCVTSESAVCVCVCISHTVVLWNNPPPSYGSVSQPFAILLFSLPLPSLWWTWRGFCHHNMIWQNVALHTCHLPGDGAPSSAGQWKERTEDGWVVRVVLTMLNRPTTGRTDRSETQRHSGEQMSGWRGTEMCSYCTMGAIKCVRNAEQFKSLL